MAQFQHYTGDPSDDQAVFDFVASHLLRQEKPSGDIESGCLLIDSEGNRCAVGVLLSEDECWDFPESEDSVVRPTSVGGFTQFLRIKGFNVNLLYELQKIHDQYFQIKAAQLKELAEMRGFDTGVLNQD